MNRYSSKNLGEAPLDGLCRRPVEELGELLPLIEQIFSRVASQGDAALRELTREYDQIDLESFEVSPGEFQEAESQVSPRARQALEYARKNIEAFHRAQYPPDTAIETAPGIRCRREWRPLERVGLYVPGGRAPLVSTVLMLGIPAKAAGCREILICTPPGPDGEIRPEILYAASILGIRKVFKLGGAQAVAAMATGTASVPKVDKIFGPGNRFVAAAKAYSAMSSRYAAIDMLAGPSELLVIADDQARPDWIAADLLSQAEHGEDSQVVLVTPSEALVGEVEVELARQLSAFDDARMVASVQSSLSKSFSLHVRSLEEAFAFSNRYAPEHLILALQDAGKWGSSVLNAGSVFLGGACSVVFGDYASGTNHTLPTSGTARSSSGLTLESFMKSVLFQEIDPSGVAQLAEETSVLARLEGLEAHARAAEARKAGETKPGRAEK